MNRVSAFEQYYVWKGCFDATVIRCYSDSPLTLACGKGAFGAAVLRVERAAIDFLRTKQGFPRFVPRCYSVFCGYSDFCVSDSVNVFTTTVNSDVVLQYCV